MMVEYMDSYQVVVVITVVMGKEEASWRRCLAQQVTRGGEA
jgi:hypothetical protein